MQRAINIIVLYVICILLAGCESSRKVRYRISAPQNSMQSACASNCDRIGSICSDVCTQNQKRCFDLQRYSVRGGYNYDPNDYFNSNHLYNCDFVLEICESDCAQNNLLCYSECRLRINKNEEQIQ